MGIQCAVSFSNNVFLVGKPSKSYQPSQTSESCGTFWYYSFLFDVDEICSVLKVPEIHPPVWCWVFGVESVGFFGGCWTKLSTHLPRNRFHSPTSAWLKIEKHVGTNQWRFAKCELKNGWYQQFFNESRWWWSFFSCSPLISGRWFHFDEHIFSDRLGKKKHQPEYLTYIMDGVGDQANNSPACLDA